MIYSIKLGAIDRIDEIVKKKINAPKIESIALENSI